MWNSLIYPCILITILPCHASLSSGAIRKKVELSHGTEDDEYLALVEKYSIFCLKYTFEKYWPYLHADCGRLFPRFFFLIIGPLKSSCYGIKHQL